MKKPLALILIAVMLLSGCGISRTPVAETTIENVPTAPEPTQAPASELTQNNQVTIVETTQKITAASSSQTPIKTAADTEYWITLKRDLLVLMIAYPSDVAGVEMKDNKIFLIMKSGKRILYDDKKKKTIEEKITDADIQDMLETAYPLTEINSLMKTNVDPGRTRVYAINNEIYGSSKDVISQKLISVDYGNQHLPFNKAAGAATALAAAAAGAAALVKEQPQIADYLYPSSGTFNYRVIAGTDRLSPHAYGIAIDLKSSSNGYWRWASPAEGEKLLQSYPQNLVRIFEKNGFIWGGKWNHFDIFHFEYRPEIIIKARYFSGKTDISKPWYQGANLNQDSENKFIALIDKSLGQ